MTPLTDVPGPFLVIVAAIAIHTVIQLIRAAVVGLRRGIWLTFFAVLAACVFAACMPFLFGTERLNNGNNALVIVVGFWAGALGAIPAVLFWGVALIIRRLSK